jgi:tetratricopeptide (TPR) repeat protein
MQSMKLLIHVVFILALLLPLPAHAEIKTITHTVQQPFGGSQSPDDARTAGIARAKREALEQFGTYIESSTVVKNSQVDSDEILALTAGVTKAEVVKQKNYTDGDAFGLEITVKVELDTAVLEQSLKRLLQDRNHLKDLKAARVREKELLARITELEKQNQQKGKSEQQKEDLKKEFQKTRDGLTAVEWFDKAAKLIIGKDSRGATLSIKNIKIALEYLTKAIQLDSVYKEAFALRGIAYFISGQYQRAVSDYNRVIRLDPTYAEAYSNRGRAYDGMEQFQLAVADYSQAIKLKSNNVHDYYNRGSTYLVLECYQEAIADFNQVIKFEPAFAAAYHLRGLAHLLSNRTDQGCRDLQIACSLGECNNFNEFCR